jgi:hypothetical protein
MAKSSNSGPLYPIYTPSSGLSEIGTTGSENRTYVRSLAAIDTVTGAVFNVVMSQPHVGDKELPFVAANDTVRRRTKENFLHLLESEPLSLTDDDDTLSFDLAINAQGWEADGKGVSFSVGLADNSNQVSELSLAALSHNMSTSSQCVQVRAAVKQLKGKQVVLRISNRCTENISNHCIYTLAHVYLLDTTDHTTKEGKIINSTGVNELQIGLGQNYPNPFNPVTQINFRLRTNARVTLKVYDLLGREVATLVDDVKETGYHSASFDGSRLSSGMYLLRFVATSLEDGESTVQTRKIVLAK